ncbi:ubiquitin-protein ligase [Culex quinquefasciatus]|uniref:Ubiquitin-protein ligase n=1 Tax=Culex quinquefasciatus TaxID=7176 RepID=B0XI39_CULQU|nr:ubiquitin-protein ligase [Culex quinquefasciatus]|eukprot:XP_001869311.1 ubiquitin-protein ligase [Culex quinquefasciatus]
MAETGGVLQHIRLPTKSSGSLAAKKKSSLLIGSGAGSSSKETNQEQRDSSPVDYLDEAKLRELMAPSSSIDQKLEKAPEDFKNLEKEDQRTLEEDLDKDEDSAAEKTPPV